MYKSPASCILAIRKNVAALPARSRLLHLHPGELEPSLEPGLQVDAGSTFRPLDSAKTRYLTPIPTQNKTLKFGDNIWITQTNPSGNATCSDKHWSVALFSSKYEALFFLSVQPIAENKGAVVFNSNNGPWFTGKWQKEERQDVGTSLNEYLWLNIKNTPEAIKVGFIFYLLIKAHSRLK